MAQLTQSNTSAWHSGSTVPITYVQLADFEFWFAHQTMIALRHPHLTFLVRRDFDQPALLNRLDGGSEGAKSYRLHDAEFWGIVNRISLLLLPKIQARVQVWANRVP